MLTRNRHIADHGRVASNTICSRMVLEFSECSRALARDSLNEGEFIITLLKSNDCEAVEWVWATTLLNDLVLSIVVLV